MRWFKAAADKPCVEIGLPMLTVIKPGRLMKAFLRQHSPALCATGSASAPVLTASQAPPGWYAARSPGATRVPSGKITILNPAASRSRPCSANWRKALLPEPRLMAIGESIARPQPKNGIHSSSRFITHTCGGKTVCQASVSHAD